ncbi:MAG: choice-of-anchor B family protein [Bacteroidia bacterium]|nr:choice-of-anchor B family protein [Bacteroidia bacterium]
MKKILFLYGCMMVFAPLFSQVEHNINLLGQWEDSSLTTNLFGDVYNDVWGYARDGREYAILGSTEGTHVLDVTDPENIVEVDMELGGYYGLRVVHRDYKVYNDYLYAVCDEGTSTLQIFDLRFLPDSVHKVYDSHKLIARAHNIFIDTSSARLYACAYSTSGLSMNLYSIEKPWAPQPLPDFHRNWIHHVHDLYVRNDTAYLNCGQDGVHIVDFSNPNAPEVLSSMMAYEGLGYNHSGWLDPSGKTYVFTDETFGTEVKVCDVSNLDSFYIRASIPAGHSDTAIAHNAFIKGDFLYLSSYHDGLQIFDISNPDNPVKTGWYDTYLPAAFRELRGAWGVYPYLPSGNILVSDMSSGLLVFNVDKALNVREPGKAPIGAEVYPNPVTSTVDISLKLAKSQDVSIKLFDTQGRLMEEKEEVGIGAGQSLSFDLTDYPSDVYFLVIETEHQVVTKKLIKLD